MATAADARRDNFGLLGFDSYHFAVVDLERSKLFYQERFGFEEVARASEEMVARTGQRSIVFGAGRVRCVISTPADNAKGSECKAARYLRRHPAGVMSLSYRVEDLDRAWKVLASRGATILAEPLEHRDGNGVYRSFEIATPLGDVSFRYIERKGDYPRFAPGFDTIVEGDPKNAYGIKTIDHVTCNALTLKPLTLWYEHVLGMEPFWEVQFHTSDVNPERPTGSGLKSLVFWDQGSHIKFANNEPMRPFFRDSQINKFVEDNNGAGIQHIAFNIPAILPTVEEMMRRGVEFLPTHEAYYKHLPQHLANLKITNVKETLDELKRLQVLVDGRDDKYMLQIFLRDAGALYNDPKAGPFFYEIIQRAGDQGFGGGNFRALFEAIEREQFSQRIQPFD